MADNFNFRAGDGTLLTAAGDDLSGVIYLRTKLGLGADGAAVDAIGGAGVNSTAVMRVTVATDDQMSATFAGNYETVAASQTDQVVGPTGATGDYLNGILVIPATTSPGAVSIKDGAGSAISIFAGGTGSVSNLVPFFIFLGARSTAGAWKVTTGASVSLIVVGKFT